MFGNLKVDTRLLRQIKSKPFPWYVLESLLFENGYQAIVLYRIAHWFKRHKIPVMGPMVARFSLFLTGVDISPAAVIGPGLFISHGVGLVIGHRVRIGKGAVLLHQVTIGSPHVGRIDDMPVLGDNVFVGAGSKLIGNITIGNDVLIGVNSVVTQDVPDNSKVMSTAEIEITPYHPKKRDEPRDETTGDAP